MQCLTATGLVPPPPNGPGPRSVRLSYPFAQRLPRAQGDGRARCRGGTITAIPSGEILTFAPGTKHWHGAAQDTPVNQSAIRDIQDGKAVGWTEKIVDAQ